MVSTFVLTALVSFIAGVYSTIALSVYAYRKQQRDGS